MLQCEILRAEQSFLSFFRLDNLVTLGQAIATTRPTHRPACQAWGHSQDFGISLDISPLLKTTDTFCAASYCNSLRPSRRSRILYGVRTATMLEFENTVYAASRVPIRYNGADWECGGVLLCHRSPARGWKRRSMIFLVIPDPAVCERQRNVSRDDCVFAPSAALQ